MKKIVLTGGGTAGHVTPNLALIPSLLKLGYDVHYIGSYEGIEKKLIAHEGITYNGISSGKLRRYLDFKNLSDPFRVIKGYGQAKKLLKEFMPDVVFSKGGFVAVPVVLAAHSLKIPVIIHESDMTPGLANKLCFRASTRICCNFPETLPLLPKDKAVLTGCPIREEILHGNRKDGQSLTGFDDSLPVLLVIGGSLGSVTVNRIIRTCLPALLKEFHIIHICGRGNVDESIHENGYLQFEYVSSELADLFAFADIIVSRGGANAICELLALRKPNILIPLSIKASRGDQILNARSYESRGFSVVIEEENLNPESFPDTVSETYNAREKYIAQMNNSPLQDSVAKIISLIEDPA